MKTVRTVSDVRAEVAEARRAGKRIGFVPTMGFLHDGHLSLVHLLRDHGADFIVVSVFVNPLQFGPSEDFDRYPRDEKRDTALLEAHGADLLFMPPVQVMYPHHSASRVVVSGVAEPLEGELRPGHFDGVATVVLKLFNIVQPDLAAFGEKDAQQCSVIEQLVRDFDIPVTLVFGKTVREADGLAMSSRNAYLTPEEREPALLLRRALKAGETAVRAGKPTEAVERAMLDVADHDGRIEVVYLRLVDPRTFQAPKKDSPELLLVGAVRVGKTRLIDNIRVTRTVIANTPRGTLQ